MVPGRHGSIYTNSIDPKGCDPPCVDDHADLTLGFNPYDTDDSISGSDEEDGASGPTEHSELAEEEIAYYDYLTSEEGSSSDYHVADEDEAVPTKLVDYVIAVQPAEENDYAYWEWLPRYSDCYLASLTLEQ